MDDRIYARLARSIYPARPESRRKAYFMPRPYDPNTEAAIRAHPKFRIHTTIQVPQDFLARITELCKATGTKKYELFIAGTYQLLLEHKLMEQDPTLDVYRQYVANLINHAKDSGRLPKDADEKRAD